MDVSSTPQNENAPTGPLLQLEDVSLAYGRRGEISIVEKITFTVPRGGQVGLVGESGSGKSTIARAILGRIAARSGTIRFFGEDGKGRTELSRRERARFVQMIFQDPYHSLNPRHTIARAMEEAVATRGNTEPDHLRRESERLLASVEMEPSALRRYPHQFSGGQRQRLCIARALAPAPRLLVCDEAVSALDVSTQAKIVNLLKNLSHRENIALLFISHDLPLVQFLCGELLVLDRGRLVEAGRTADILKNPTAAKTQSLIESVLTLTRPAAASLS